MKIGIVGNYGHDNNGDEAILQGILLQLKNEYQIKSNDLLIFSNNPENTKKRYNIASVPLIKKQGSFLASVVTTLIQHINLVRKLDVLILGGGGVLMDMFKRDAPLYSSLVFIAKLFKCKIIIYGVGAGPINTKLGRFLIKGMVHASSLTAVRDLESKQLLEEKGVRKPIHVIPDPALSLGNSASREETNELKRIGVTAVPYYSSAYWPKSDEAVYQSYIQAMAASLDRIVKECDVEITFFSTKYPQDVQVTKDIYERMTCKDSATIVDKNLKPDELIQLAGSLDLIIGTRLHSLILAVAAGVPIVGIGYHPKVYSFLKKLNYLSGYVSLENLEDPNEMLKRIKYNRENWMTVQSEMKRISEQAKQETVRSSQLMQQIIQR
ncbi:polysaccharide pyruvyl transferase family protein [Rossellomorea sp. KS-H15a]|uniref:polysaccharide pyruvyl transferase family protein n=1 Tax=Rossellomorea sp. KS-H15a TaxID=2963940 RepID=UPI0020C65BF9|nr:polysaccharide pyruvyl transferase family protein [Rossellomorea sp. KS-H15a]UTE77348.1 polysaccharide pyruvyl transferase family protein [Rossellomorea sp. KS-H15a]